MLKKCIFKGGDLCKRHGGSGSLKHAGTYAHPRPGHIELLNKSVNMPNVKDCGQSLVSKALEGWFDDGVAQKALMESPEAVVDARTLVKKSLYDFDVNSIEGIGKLLYLLPIVDDKVVELVAQDLWPGYPIDENFEHKKVRFEIKGFLLDFLYGFEEKFNSTGTGYSDDFEGTEADAAPVAMPGDSPAEIG